MHEHRCLYCWYLWPGNAISAGGPTIFLVAPLPFEPTRPTEKLQSVIMQYPIHLNVASFCHPHRTVLFWFTLMAYWLNAGIESDAALMWIRENFHVITGWVPGSVQMMYYGMCTKYEPWIMLCYRLWWKYSLPSEKVFLLVLFYACETELLHFRHYLEQFGSHIFSVVVYSLRHMTSDYDEPFTQKVSTSGTKHTPKLSLWAAVARVCW